MTARPLPNFENAILDLFEKNRITIHDAKIVLWILLTAICCAYTFKLEDDALTENKTMEIVMNNTIFTILDDKTSVDTMIFTQHILKVYLKNRSGYEIVKRVHMHHNGGYNN